MDNYEVFERLRELKIQLEQLKADYKRQTPTVQSPRLDGMPKSAQAGDANPAWVDKRDSLARRIKCNENEYRNKLRMANKLMENMPLDRSRRCQGYVINAYEVDHTCIVLEFSRRTFYNRMNALDEYMKTIEEV